MPKLRNGNKEGDSNPGSLDCESGILPLSYHAPHRRIQGGPGGHVPPLDRLKKEMFFVCYRVNVFFLLNYFLCRFFFVFFLNWLIDS